MLVLRNVDVGEGEDVVESILDHFVELGRARMAEDPSLDDRASRHVPLIVVLDDENASLELLDEADMRRHGWVRCEPG